MLSLWRKDSKMQKLRIITHRPRDQLANPVSRLPLLVLQLLHTCPCHVLKRQSVNWTQWTGMSITCFAMKLGYNQSAIPWCLEKSVLPYWLVNICLRGCWQLLGESGFKNGASPKTSLCANTNANSL